MGEPFKKLWQQMEQAERECAGSIATLEKKLIAAQQENEGLLRRLAVLERERAEAWPVRVQALEAVMEPLECWVVGAADDGTFYWMDRGGELSDDYDATVFTREEADRRVKTVSKLAPGGEPQVLHAIEWHLQQTLFSGQCAAGWVNEWLLNLLKKASVPLV